MDTQNRINDSYDKLAKTYDAVLSVQKPWVRAASKIIWGFRDTVYVEELLTWLPDDFSGNLLDVPVGTALFTLAKYRAMKNAKITCLDYSQKILEAAKKRFNQNGLESIVCMRGDIGNLPYEAYGIEALKALGSIVYFKCVKKGRP